MKSIRTWMEENGIGADDIKNIDLTRILGTTNITINRKLAMRLGPKLDQVLKGEEFASENPSELLRQIIAIAAEKVAGVSGMTVSTSKLAKGLGRMDDPIAREVG